MSSIISHIKNEPKLTKHIFQLFSDSKYFCLLIMFSRMKVLNGCLNIAFTRRYRLPTNFVPFMNNYCQVYENQESEVVKSFTHLKTKLAEHEELGLMIKSTDKELSEMAAADVEVVEDSIEELFEEITDYLG